MCDRHSSMPAATCARSRASGLLVAAATVGALFSGCTDDPEKSVCTVESSELAVPHSADPAATPLMLLPDARLDEVAGGFALLGSDGNTVRWALLGTDGILAAGGEQSIVVPPHRAGPWFAVAGVNAPKDHLVVAYVPAEAAGSSVLGGPPLMTFSVAIDKSEVSDPVSSGPISLPAEIVMVSGRAGMQAGIAWAKPGATTVAVRLLGGDGLPVADDLDLGKVADTVPGCLRFSSGKGDLTVGYIDMSDARDPTFVGSEIATDGSVTTPLHLRIGKEQPGCVQLTPSDVGYGAAWHSSGVGDSGLGTYFGVYDLSHPGFPSVQVLSDVRVSGTPPLVGGIGWLGMDYAIVFARESGAEAWPVDATGRRHGVLPVFPSLAGYTGPLSSQTVGSALYATYADYTRANDRTAGSRLLVKVSCP